MSKNSGGDHFVNLGRINTESFIALLVEILMLQGFWWKWDLKTLAVVWSSTPPQRLLASSPQGQREHSWGTWFGWSLILTEMTDFWDQLQRGSSTLFGVNQGLYHCWEGVGISRVEIQLSVPKNASFAWKDFPGILGACWAGLLEKESWPYNVTKTT